MINGHDISTTNESASAIIKRDLSIDSLQAETLRQSYEIYLTGSYPPA
jgi:hypothetical protein